MEEKRNEIEILEMFYQNILSTKEYIVIIIKSKTLNENLNNDLKQILLLYKKMIISIKGMLKNRNRTPKDLSDGERFITYFSAKIGMKQNEENSELAIILIQNIKYSTQGVERVLLEYKKISKNILNLAKKMKDTNEKCVEILSKYGKIKS